MKTKSELRAGAKKKAWLLALLLLPLGLLVFFLVSALRTGPTHITVQQVEQFLKAVDAASVKKDPHVLLSHMAEEAVITVKFKTPQGSQTNRYTGKEYAQRVKKELAALQGYQYERMDTKIEISPNQQAAKVSMHLVEFIAVPQGRLRILTKQAVLYSLKRGKLWIQAVNSESEAGPVR